ncbi:hypothetical protein [Kordia jejudonensis]|uniref:hypothetical protein n=1 Tax=Kordia jejudonensis TaxID=1348245 RepID=UPI00138E28F2|nr:hypothetical protein [Kordia jejudonensis]
MKKKNVKNLALSKRSISRFNTAGINGGALPSDQGSYAPSKEREWMSLPYSHCC